MTEPTPTQYQAWRRLWEILLAADVHPEAEGDSASINNNAASQEQAESGVEG